MNRKITIKDSFTNSRYVVEGDINTFGELKEAARAKGMSVEGKDWCEAITRTMPTDNASILPSNVTFKGNITNDLVFLVTNTNKKISLGALSRIECYQKIKELGLQTDIKNTLGVNSYTNASTEDLNVYLESVEGEVNEVADNTEKEEDAPTVSPEIINGAMQHALTNYKNVLLGLVEDITRLQHEVSEVLYKGSPYTDDEIDELCDSLMD